MHARCLVGINVSGVTKLVTLQKKMILWEKAESEKQIWVDPISVTNMHPIKYPASAKFISCSLPTSPKHKKKHQVPFARQHSVALGNLERLRRSKSCGEGRACQPSLDFDMWEASVDGRRRGGGDDEEEKFKCGACLFLPGLGKAKTVRARKELEMVVSHRVSLEKFECGSWRSSALINYNDEDGATATSNRFFDLPLELIRCSSVNDAHSPVTTGFLFDNSNHRKGVLKACTTKSQELSNSSPRHVRFSTSSPTSPSCITPRLHKARDDFNAFLEAQSA